MEVELTLKQRLLHEINIRSKCFVAELVKISGYSNLQNFKRCLTSDREFDKFQGLIDVVEFIWGDKYVELLAQYSKEIDPNKKSARSMLEFLCANRSLEAFKLLLDRMTNCVNKESKEWAKVYSIQYFCQVNVPNIDYDNIIHQCKTFKTNIPELLVFLKLIQSYCYHRLVNYHMNQVLAEEIKYYLAEIENGYIKEMYIYRLGEIMSMITLRVFNQPEVCREYVERLTHSKMKQFRAFALFQKGYSYFFTSYEKAHKYLTESMKIYETINMAWAKDLEEKVEFLNIYWDKHHDKGCKYLKNYFLYNIKKGVNVSKALEDSKNEINDEPMYLYLKGCNDKNYVVLIESVLIYVKNGDSFLGTLAKNELKRLNYPNLHLIETLQAIRTT